MSVSRVYLDHNATSPLRAEARAAMIEAFRLGGAQVHAWDDSGPAVEKAKAVGLPISDLHALDFSRLNALILSPGVPLTVALWGWPIGRWRGMKRP